MVNRSARAAIARETVEILERGDYTDPDGVRVSISDLLHAAREGTKLYAPEDAASLLSACERRPSSSTTEFCVRNRTTFAAARELTDTGLDDPLCLNFASARNPGGGFLNGSQAQEECLARASGLYSCIEPVSRYYDANRGFDSSLYTDHVIYSPKVPVFRDDDDRLLPVPFTTSIVTAPAANAGAVEKNEPMNRSRIKSTMLERIERVLAVAVVHGHDAVVLGAWGCGVFRNDPVDVADWFHHTLTENERIAGRFRRVEFAVLDHSETKSTFDAFHRRFST